MKKYILFFLLCAMCPNTHVYCLRSVEILQVPLIAQLDVWEQEAQIAAEETRNFANLTKLWIQPKGLHIWLKIWVDVAKKELYCQRYSQDRKEAKGSLHAYPLSKLFRAGTKGKEASLDYTLDSHSGKAAFYFTIQIKNSHNAQKRVWVITNKYTPLTVVWLGTTSPEIRKVSRSMASLYTPAVSMWSVAQKKQAADRIRECIKSNILTNPYIIGLMITPFIEYGKDPQNKNLINSMYRKTVLAERVLQVLAANRKKTNTLKTIQTLLVNYLQEEIIHMSDQVICERCEQFDADWYITSFPVFSRATTVTPIKPMRFLNIYNRGGSGTIERSEDVSAVEYLVYLAWAFENRVLFHDQNEPSLLPQIYSDVLLREYSLVSQREQQIKKGYAESTTALFRLCGLLKKTNVKIGDEYQETLSRDSHMIEKKLQDQNAMFPEYYQAFLSLIALLPQEVIAEAKLNTLVLLSDRAGGALNSAYSDETGTLFLFRTGIYVSRSNFIATGLHEIGHAIGAGLSAKMQKRFMDYHAVLVKKQGVFLGSNCMGGGEVRIERQYSFCEFMAELNMLYVAQGNRLRAFINTLSDLAARQAWITIYELYRTEVYKGVEYGMERECFIPLKQQSMEKDDSSWKKWLGVFTRILPQRVTAFLYMQKSN